MTQWIPHDEYYAQRVHASFERQGIMDTLGARLCRVGPGEVEIQLEYRPGLSQQHGFFHAGVTTTIADSAGGYAAYSLFPPDASVLTVEFKINLLAPADGERLRAIGRVYKSGRTLTLCDVEVFVSKAGREKVCAKMQQTLMRLEARSDIMVAG
ncbi:MAG TPA: PaaI family thioesterase [Kiloniellales bacterium]|nr:PaaI family thioesterase [Kiloniellales bacterium]